MWLNFMSVLIINSNKYHSSCVMYVHLYAECVWHWSWWLTQDHFLIKHWSQHPYRCSAPVVSLEEYSLGLVSRYSTVRSKTVTWREWGLWLSFHGCPVGIAGKRNDVTHVNKQLARCTLGMFGREADTRSRQTWPMRWFGYARGT